MYPGIKTYEDLLERCDPVIAGAFARGQANAPNYGVTEENFRESLHKTIRRFLAADQPNPVEFEELSDFINQLQIDDLFMTIACSNGSERAWWEFDHQHRSYMERVARHLAKTEIDAQEVIDTVYVELYGTRVVDGERVSKFASYSGRGSLRGWLRTVIWHSLVDLHRASHDEVSLDEMTETVGEGAAHANFAESPRGGENEMLEHVARERYRKATLTAVNAAFSTLDAHEKLLLLYYHVESLKLREIARLVENENSPLRGWFQRKSATRDKEPSSRIHESTIMRWLEKSYAKVLQIFRGELTDNFGFNEEEIQICIGLATQDLSTAGFYQNLMTTGS